MKSNMSLATWSCLNILLQVQSWNNLFLLPPMFAKMHFLPTLSALEDLAADWANPHEESMSLNFEVQYEWQTVRSKMPHFLCTEKVPSMESFLFTRKSVSVCKCVMRGAVAECVPTVNMSINSRKIFFLWECQAFLEWFKNTFMKYH